MSFFDITRPSVSPPWGGSERPAWERPDGVNPGVAHIGLMLIRTDEVAVAVTSVAAYPNGFEFTVEAQLHHQDLTWGISPLDPASDPRSEQDPDQALRLGVLYADGRRARTSTYQPVPAESGWDENLILQETSTGGTGRMWRGEFWVHPLPPDGPVTFVVSWLLRDVPETRTDLDGSVIHEAASRAVIVWPEEP